MPPGADAEPTADGITGSGKAWPASSRSWTTYYSTRVAAPDPQVVDDGVGVEGLAGGQVCHERGNSGEVVAGGDEKVSPSCCQANRLRRALAES